MKAVVLEVRGVGNLVDAIAKVVQGIGDVPGVDDVVGGWEHAHEAIGERAISVNDSLARIGDGETTGMTNSEALGKGVMTIEWQIFNGEGGSIVDGVSNLCEGNETGEKRCVSSMEGEVGNCDEYGDRRKVICFNYEAGGDC